MPNDVDDILLNVIAELDAGLDRKVIFPSFERQLSATRPGGHHPRWWSEFLPFRGSELRLYRCEGAYYVPHSGAIILSNGSIIESTVQQSRYVDPDLLKVKAAWMARSDAPVIKQAAITLPWGSLHNYGHFILDGLSISAQIAATYPGMSIVTPPLKSWQREHFSLIDVKTLELDQEIYMIEDAVFTSGMKGSIHFPNEHYTTLRTAQWGSVPSGGRWPSKIYITRRGHKRPFANEEEVEHLLRARGFKVIQPENLSVREQIDLFRTARYIVAPTGAALANIMYCQPGVKVVEIIPRDVSEGGGDFGHKWVAYLVEMAQGSWFPYFCENLTGIDLPTVGGKPRSGYVPFEADVTDLLDYIDQILPWGSRFSAALRGIIRA